MVQKPILKKQQAQKEKELKEALFKSVAGAPPYTLVTDVSFGFTYKGGYNEGYKHFNSADEIEDPELRFIAKNLKVGHRESFGVLRSLEHFGHEGIDRKRL